MTLLAVILLAVALPPTEPEPIVIPPPALIHGLVVDKNGQPVAGAELFLGGMPDNLKLANPVSWTGRSDAQGRFVVDSTKFWLDGVSFLSRYESVAAYGPGFGVAAVLVGRRADTSPANPLKIVLQPAVAAGVPLRLVAPDGRPVAGAKISKNKGMPNGAILPEALVDRLAVTTGADGRANLSAFSPEDCEGVDVEAPSFGTQSLSIDPKAVGERTLTLHAVGRLSGRLVVDAPAKLEGLKILGWTMAGPTLAESRIVGMFEVITTADGRFEVPALAAGALVIRSVEGQADLILKRNRLSQELARVVAGETTKVDIVLKTGLPIQGTLRERISQRPIVNASVQVVSRGGGYFIERTDRAGRFKGFVLPGEVTLTLGYAGPYVLPKEASIKLGTITADAKQFDVGVVEVVPGINVQGVVRDELGKPAAGATIGGRILTDGRWIFNVLRTPAPVANAKGEFVMESMPPGRPLEVTAQLGDAATASPTSVLPGVTQNLVLIVNPANTVSLGGRVVDDYGKPIAGAVIHINSRWKTSTGAEGFPNYGSTEIVTDRDGRFQTPHNLVRYARHQAEARIPGKQPNSTVWFASTTPSFFELTLHPNPPADQLQLRADFDAGVAAERKGDFAEAQAKIESALKRASEQKVIDPLLLSWWRAGLVDVLLDRGQFADAEREARVVLDLREKALPADNPEVAQALKSLAFACMRQNKFADAERLYARALNILERKSGTDRPEYGWILYESGYLALLRERNAEAEKLLNRSCRILEKIYGPDDPGLITILINRGYVLSLLEQFDEAEPVFTRALKLVEKVDGVGAPRAVDLVDRLVFVLRKRGKNAEADDLEARPRRPQRKADL